MEEVCDEENLERAWKRVNRNKGGRRGWNVHRRGEAFLGALAQLR